MNGYNYEYAGVHFESNMEFPFFYQAAMVSAHKLFVHIEGLSMPIQTSQFISFSNGRYFINFQDKGYYEVEKEGIICRFKDKQFVNATICNIPFAILSILNGIIPLHGSAVADERCVYIFVGEKGAGKSTLAYLLSTYGAFEMMGDDVIGLSSDGSGEKIAMRGTRAMKLCESFCSFEGISKQRELYKNWGKYIVDVPHVATSAGKPVGQIYSIGRGDTIQCRHIPSALVESVLYRHVVGIPWLESLLQMPIRNLIRPVCDVPLNWLRLPAGLDVMKEKIGEVTSYLDKGAGPP